MFIRMLETRRGSEDGHSVKCFEEGESYEVADTLARSFVASGWAAEEEPEPSIAEQLFQSFKPMTAEEEQRIFRPQPTRGMAPQNPATYGDKV